MLKKIFYGAVASASALIALGIGTILLYANNDFVKEAMDTAVDKMVVKMEQVAEDEDDREDNAMVTITDSELQQEYNFPEEETNAENLPVDDTQNDTSKLESTNQNSVHNDETQQEDRKENIDEDEPGREYPEKPIFDRLNKGYLYSSELYFDIEKNRRYGVDQEQLDFMAKCNQTADELERQGKIQKDMDYKILSDVKVKYYGGNTYINPYQESPLRNCYAVEGMPVPYYIDEEFAHVANGNTEWEVVLNHFMEAIFNYLSVKEAKKFVDVDSAYLMAEPGEDIESHTKNTDKCIAALLLQTTSALATTQNSNGRYIAQGSYYLDNIVNIPYGGTELARATVDALFMRVEPAVVPEEEMVALDPNRTYITTYVDDPNTGKKLCFGYKFASRQFEVSMVKDNNGDWKIVCVEP